MEIFIIFLFLIALVVGIILVIDYNAKQKEAMSATMNSITGFSPSLTYQCLHFGIGVDETRCLLAVVYPQKKRMLSFSDILQVSLLRNGEVIRTETRKQGAISRAVVGGLLFGPAGAIVGATSADEQSVSESHVTSFALHILVNEIANPSIELDFDDEKTARKWYDIFQVIIHQTNKQV